MSAHKLAQREAALREANAPQAAVNFTNTVLEMLTAKKQQQVRDLVKAQNLASGTIVHLRSIDAMSGARAIRKITVEIKDGHGKTLVNDGLIAAIEKTLGKAATAFEPVSVAKVDGNDAGPKHAAQGRRNLGTRQRFGK